MYLPSSGDVPMASVLIKTWEKGEEYTFLLLQDIPRKRSGCIQYQVMGVRYRLILQSTKERAELS